MTERTEAWMRVVVGIISGLIIGIWKGLIQIIAIIHWIIVLFTGKRNKDLARFCNIWNTQVYKYIRYMTMTTNERPFPFSSLGKNKDPVDMKKK